MDGCGNTSRMDTAYQTIKLHSGRLNGLFYTSRLIPRVSLDVQVILSSSAGCAGSGLILLDNNYRR